MHVGSYVGLAHESEERFMDAINRVSEHHKDEPDIYAICRVLAGWSSRHIERLKPLVQKYGENKNPEPAELEGALFRGPRKGSLGLLRDLHDLWLMSNEVQLCWIVLEQAAQALRDEELEQLCQEASKDTKRQTAFFLTRIKQAAPQALVVA